jgi:hypothetical protein
VEDDDQEELDRVGEWIGRLKAFTAALDDIEGNDATDFCDNACEAWQEAALPTVTSPSPSALVIFEALTALAKAATTVWADWKDTPDVRDRYTRETAQQLVKDALEGVLSAYKPWLSDGLPPSDQIQQRFREVAADVKEIMDAIAQMRADMDAQDAEAEADPYGAILVHLDPSRSDAPIFEKVCSLTEEEDKRYRDAYERLRKMLDSELLGHISDESDRFLNQLVSILEDLRDNKIGIFDEDAFDERRRKVRSALISFTSALQSHEDQTIRAVRDTFGRRTPQEQAVLGLFNDLKANSFDYRWLLEMRDALLHGDINAFKYDFAARLHGENAVNVYMDRQYMFDFTKEARNKPWLKRGELQDRKSDPSVLNMIQTIQPLMGPLQEKLDQLLYPDAGEDAATVRELLARYPDKRGQRASRVHSSRGAAIPASSGAHAALRGHVPAGGPVSASSSRTDAGVHTTSTSFRVLPCLRRSPSLREPIAVGTGKVQRLRG